MSRGGLGKVSTPVSQFVIQSRVVTLTSNVSLGWSADSKIGLSDRVRDRSGGQCERG